MSTRSLIGYKDGDDIKAVYHHWDGYPTGVGHTIQKLVHGLWHPEIEDGGDYTVTINGVKTMDIGGVKYTPENAVKAFCRIYVDGHPDGWSVLPDKCHCHDPQFVIRDGEHARRTLIASDGIDSLFHEWLYIIDRDACTMEVWASGTSKGFSKWRDKPDEGRDYAGGYHLAGLVDLRKDPIDLESLETAASEFRESDK